MLGRGITVMLVSSLLVPAGAAAQSHHPDPDSPAGSEYELPLEQSRADLSDGGADRGPGGGKTESSPEAPGDVGADGADGAAPLFGAGISREGGSGEGEGSGRTSLSNGDRPDPVPAGGASADGDAGEQSPAVTKASAGDDGSTGLLILGLALLVILAGGAMGLLLRRGLGSPGS